MTYVKSTLLALAAACAISGPALAQGEGMSLRDSTVLIMAADGRMMTRPVTDKAMVDAMVQKGMQVAAGSMLLMSGGKLYLVQDTRAPNGKFMSEILMSAN